MTFNIFRSGEFNKTKDRLEELVEKKLINRRKHPEHDLWIYAYSKTCQLGQKWEHWTETCRGLILDAEGNVIARPFAKFFNWDEGLNRKLLHKKAIVGFEKMDGSLGIVYYPPDATGPNDVCVATKGSFDSEQAIWATNFIRRMPQYLLDELWEVDKTYTVLFEIIYPGNQIVVNYGLREDLVMLGMVQKDNGAFIPSYPGVLDGFSRPRFLTNISPADVFDHLKADNEEGYVLLYEGNLLVKVKFDEYVLLHRMVTKYSKRQVVEKLMQDWHWEPDEELANYHVMEKDRQEIVGEIDGRISTAVEIASNLAKQNLQRKKVAEQIAQQNDRDLCFIAYDGVNDIPGVTKRMRDLMLKNWKKRLKNEGDE